MCASKHSMTEKIVRVSDRPTNADELSGCDAELSVSLYHDSDNDTLETSQYPQGFNPNPEKFGHAEEGTYDRPLVHRYKCANESTSIAPISTYTQTCGAEEAPTDISPISHEIPPAARVPRALMSGHLEGEVEGTGHFDTVQEPDGRSLINQNQSAHKPSSMVAMSQYIIPGRAEEELMKVILARLEKPPATIPSTIVSDGYIEGFKDKGNCNAPLDPALAEPVGERPTIPPIKPSQYTPAYQAPAATSNPANGPSPSFINFQLPISTHHHQMPLTSEAGSRKSRQQQAVYYRTTNNRRVRVGEGDMPHYSEPASKAKIHKDLIREEKTPDPLNCTTRAQIIRAAQSFEGNKFPFRWSEHKDMLEISLKEALITQVNMKLESGLVGGLMPLKDMDIRGVAPEYFGPVLFSKTGLQQRINWRWCAQHLEIIEKLDLSKPNMDLEELDWLDKSTGSWMAPPEELEEGEIREEEVDQYGIVKQEGEQS
ncbi:unnamed protein product [Periconia digitata]|uniref:Uncharacterized protein n=1 Tax=Periconia digitata TaxID=1303443 RepID=A0A9W4U1D9_9PLEO|nr:unnamed protein product [Periconia digitata]